MSSGGTSNYSSGATGGGTGVTPEPSAPYAQSAPAPSGGKGGYNPNPYSQQQPQQPQVYMPPSQPTFYDQAFMHMQPRMEAPPRQYGLGGMDGGNAYARPFRSYGSPVEAPPPPDEMRFVPAVMPAEYPTRRNPFADGGQLSDTWARRKYPVGPMPDMRMSDPQPVEATRGVVPEPNYSGGLGSLTGAGLSGYSPPTFNNPPPPKSADPLDEFLPNGLTRRMQNAGWKVFPDGTMMPPGI